MSNNQSKYLEEISKCVRCGSCKTFCPTYNNDATEVMGARGRLALLKGFANGQIKPSLLINERIFSCIMCGACKELCPLGVDIPEAIFHGRALLKNTDKKRKYFRFFAKLLTKWPGLSFKIFKMSQNILMPALIKRNVIPFTPELPESPFRSAEQVYKVNKRRGRVAVFTGCSVNFLFPHLGDSLINTLKKFGYEVIIPKGAVCCGTPLRALGLEDEAVELAKKNLGIFGRLKVDAILSPCPTCTHTLKDDYLKIIGDGLEKAVDISVFFNDKLTMTESINKTSVYHDPCHLYYSLGVKKEPREIIKKAGVDLVDLEEAGCCGFGGIFCLSSREISNNLLSERTKKIMDSRADTVITSCPGCMLQLSRTITDRPVIHLIELIEEAYCYRTAGKTREDLR